jgi:hypothetical protein
MYLIFCLLANALSLFAPVPVAAGAFKPTSIQGIPLLLHLAFFFLFPLLLTPALVPFGIEAVLAALGWVEGVPIHLVLSVLLSAGVIFLYRLVLGWEGSLLLARERKILHTVASRAE